MDRTLPISCNLCSLRIDHVSEILHIDVDPRPRFFFGPHSACRGNARSDRHVVVVVWDGMRPDFVSEETTPTLWKLAREGVTFRNHHPVYPSATQVNGTALVTGVYPGKNGVIANYEYRPEIDRSAIN